MATDTMGSKDAKHHQDQQQRQKRAGLLSPIFYIKFAKGFGVGLAGLLKAATSPDLRRICFFQPLSTSSIHKGKGGLLGWVLMAMLVVYPSVLCLGLPLRFFLWLLSCFFSFFFHEDSTLQTALASASSTLAPWSLFLLLIEFIPFLFVFLLRTFASSFQERIFFASLTKQAPPGFVKRLEEIPSNSVRNFQEYLFRMLRLTGIGVGIWLLSKLPLVGGFVIPLVQYNYTRKIFGPPAALIFAIIPIFIPSLKPAAGLLLRTLIAANALSRELCDPYVSRMKTGSNSVSSGRRKGEEEEQYLLRRYHGTLLGFAVPVVLLLSIPFLGPLCFGFAQAAAADVLLNILKRNKAKLLLQQRHEQERGVREESLPTIGSGSSSSRRRTTHLTLLLENEI